MADKNDKVQENVEGIYYVDQACIGCAACVDAAPENFVMNDDNMAYVKKQPANAEEESACVEAKDSCPTDAIGDDG